MARVARFGTGVVLFGFFGIATVLLLVVGLWWFFSSTIAAKATEAARVQRRQQLLLARSVSGPSTKLTTSPVAASPVAASPVAAPTAIDVVKLAHIAKELANLTSGPSLPFLSLAFQMEQYNEERRQYTEQQNEQKRQYNEQRDEQKRQYTEQFNEQKRQFQTGENRTLSKEDHDAKVIDLGFFVRVDTSSMMATFAFPVLLAIAVTGALFQCCKKDASDPSTILKTAVIIYVIGMFYVAVASSSWFVAGLIVGGAVLGIVFFVHAFKIHFQNMNSRSSSSQVVPP